MASSGRLHGKVAIVTGAGSGIGEGIARKFVDEGAKVLVFEINEKNATRVADSLPRDQATAFAGDVLSEQDWQRAVEDCATKLGGLDIVVNNAGVVHCSGVGNAVFTAPKRLQIR